METIETEKLTAAGLARAFPSKFQTQAKRVCGSILRYSLPGSKDWIGRFNVNVNDEVIWVPSRVYFEKVPFDFAHIDEDEHLMQQCIFTRHHSGYKRQAALAKIISSNKSWTLPFIVFLVGEYVIEILDDIYADLSGIDDDKLGQFLANNPEFHLLTRERVVSYWDVYYRRNIPRNEYVGFKILEYFQDALISHSPELGSRKVWKRF
ncbi:hypothetical protein [Parasphingorhabdus sp.]|uniref:hypothetical protein n=1 Tax=Parasphingorhabdus sp. TaxID=2709688 RepID=UPI003D2ACE90